MELRCEVKLNDLMFMRIKVLTQNQCVTVDSLVETAKGLNMEVR